MTDTTNRIERPGNVCLAYLDAFADQGVDLDVIEELRRKVMLAERASDTAAAYWAENKVLRDQLAALTDPAGTTRIQTKQLEALIEAGIGLATEQRGSELDWEQVASQVRGIIDDTAS